MIRKLSINLAVVAWLSACSTVLSAPAPAGWEDANQKGLNCTVERSDGSKGIYVRALPGGDLQLTVFNDAWRLAAGEVVSLDIKIDNVQISDQWPYQKKPDGARLSWPGMAAMLPEAKQLSVQGEDLELTLDMTGAAEAIPLATNLRCA